MPPQNQNLAATREEARLALAGDEHRAARAAREELIGKRRAEARLAMESPAHRARREAKERAVRETATIAAAASAAVNASRAAAAKLTADAATRTAGQAAAKQANETSRMKAVREATAEIKDLRGRPTRLSAIRTLKTDMAEAANRGGSIAGAIIRGGDLETNQISFPPRRSHAMFTIILILIFLGIMAGGGTLIYQKWLANLSVPICSNASSHTQTCSKSFN